MSDTARTAGRDDVVRAVFPGAELRQTEGDTTPPRLVGRFAVFDQWTEIDSLWEGRFMERIAPGAFADTFQNDRASMRVLFQHGRDPQVGDKPLGPIDVLEEDGKGARYEVTLLDTAYVRDLIPGLEAGLYGASFRFQVTSEDLVQKPARSKYNPDGIPERTITGAAVREFGPVTFPAYAGATAGIRSLTDQFREGTPPDRVSQPARKEPPVSLPVAPTPLPEAPIPAAVNRADRPARITELRALANTFVNEHTGTLSREEEAEWDAMRDELRRLEADERADAERRAFVAERAAIERNTETAVPTAIYRDRMPNVQRERVRDIYDLAEIRSVANGEADHRQLLKDSARRSADASRYPSADDQTRARAQVEHILDTVQAGEQGADPVKEVATRMLQTGSEGYRRTFGKMVAGLPLTPEEQRYAAIAVIGTTTTGGYAVPYQFDPTIIHTGAYTNINPFRVICRVETIAGGNVWRGVSAGAVLAAYRAEGAAMTEGGPTFALPTYTAQRADSFITLSREALQDRPDLGAELGSLIAEAKDTLEENQFSIGVGTTVYPSGMFVKSKFTPAETITNDTFAVADLDATEAALPLRHRRDAVWMYARGVIRIIQGWETAYGKLFNSTLGYPAVGDIANNPGGNTGMSLLGYPVWETPSAPVTVTTDDTIVGILVSPKNYIIVDRIGMEVEIIPNMFDATTGFPTGQRGLQAFWRNTAGPVNADAGRQVNIN